MWRGNVFVVSVYLSVSVSVCVSVRPVTFEADGIDEYHIQVKFEYQSHWAKVRSKHAGGWPSTERHSCLLMKSFRIIVTDVLPRYFSSFSISCLKYCSSIWFSEIDSHLKLPDNNVHDC